MSVRNAKFSRLKSFIELQLPSGFPVRISIPLFHMINAQITFRNVNEPSVEEKSILPNSELNELGFPIFKLNQNLFQIPNHFKVYSTKDSLLFDNMDKGMQNNANKIRTCKFLEEEILLLVNLTQIIEYKKEKITLICNKIANRQKPYLKV